MDLVELRLLVLGGLLAVGVLSVGLVVGAFAVAGWANRLRRRLMAGRLARPGGAPGHATRLAGGPGGIRC